MSKDRFNFIKLKINTNNGLATMIDNKRYALNDASELVNKIAQQKISKNNAIKAYNNLVNKAEQIAKLRSTSHRQKMLNKWTNWTNSGTNELHRFKLDLADKLNLKNPNKNTGLANLSIYYTWKNIKSEYNNNKFKISASAWNDTFDLSFDLSDGSYSTDDIQDYFEYII